MTIERTIFSNLVFNEEFTRKVIPFLKSEYFSDMNEKTVYELIDSYIQKYNECPTLEALAIDLSNKDKINDTAFKDCKEILSSLKKEEVNLDWIIESTEKFCQEKSIYNALMKSISIIDDKTGKLEKGTIPQILSDAIAVSFDNHIGHDFIEDADARFEYYHRKEERIPFDIDYLNEITNGGLPKKTLNMIMAPTGVGKTLVMCHMAAHNLASMKNVLYITLEMSEEEISRRIDANLLDIPIKELETIPKDIYDKKIERLKNKVKQGKLIVKEYPTTGANAANIRHLLNELKIKKNFVPDIVYIDYLNICSSSRLKMSSAINSYTLVKAIAEEIRGLAVENNIPFVSATQTNRDGFGSSDLTLSDVSESAGLPMTADFMIGLTVSEELYNMNQMLVKQLGKNRYADSNHLLRFVIGVDRLKMRLYNIEESGQNVIGGPNSIKEDNSVFDSTKFGKRENEKFITSDMFKDFT